MDVIEAHARRLPAIDDRWTPRSHAREELESALMRAKVAGIATHGLDNVRNNAALLLEGDADKTFGLPTPRGLTVDDVLDLVAEGAGVPIDHDAVYGDVHIAPAPVLDACAKLGERLMRAAEAGEAIVVATGHPSGLILLYVELAKFAAEHGAKVLTPADEQTWEGPAGLTRQIRYMNGVAMLTDLAEPRHTHAPEAMQRILANARPDLVFADHGFAGAAIAAGIETVSIADVNDPALIVAKAQGMTDVVVVMDDHVAPDDYWPCFQAAVAAAD